LGLEREIANGRYRTVSPGANVEALNIVVVVVCGVALIASLLLFSLSAHLGSAPTTEPASAFARSVRLLGLQ
jgi:hypothetical protein